MGLLEHHFHHAPLPSRASKPKVIPWPRRVSRQAVSGASRSESVGAGLRQRIRNRESGESDESWIFSGPRRFCASWLARLASVAGASRARPFPERLASSLTTPTADHPKSPRLPARVFFSPSVSKSEGLKVESRKKSHSQSESPPPSVLRLQSPSLSPSHLATHPLS
jgi:hypothetical protein